MHLRCSNQACAATLDLHDRVLSCPVCADLLEVVVDSVAETPAELKRAWLGRRCSYAPLDASGVWRFREFLPDCYSDVVTMAEGNNPLGEGPKDRTLVRSTQSQLQASRVESDCVLQRSWHDGRHDRGGVCWRKIGRLRFHRKHRGLASRLCGPRRADRQGVPARRTGLAEQAGAGARLRSGSGAGRWQLRPCTGTNAGYRRAAISTS